MLKARRFMGWGLRDQEKGDRDGDEDQGLGPVEEDEKMPATTRPTQALRVRVKARAAGRGDEGRAPKPPHSGPAGRERS